MRYAQTPLQRGSLESLRQRQARENALRQIGEFIGGCICLAILYGVAWLALEVLAR